MKKATATSIAPVITEKALTMQAGTYSITNITYYDKDSSVFVFALCDGFATRLHIAKDSPLYNDAIKAYYAYRADKKAPEAPVKKAEKAPEAPVKKAEKAPVKAAKKAKKAPEAPVKKAEKAADNVKPAETPVKPDFETKQRETIAAALAKAADAVKAQKALLIKRRKTGSSGIIAEIDAELIKLGKVEAEETLRAHALELAMNPEASIDIEIFDAMTKKLNGIYPIPA